MSIVQLRSGKPWSVTSPRAEDVNAEDIAHALAKVCRFGGQCLRFYSVAEHSVNCARAAEAAGLSRELQLEALLHDAHEAYPPGDVAAPALRLLPDAQDMSNAAAWAVRSHFGVPLSLSDAVREIDLRMLATEKRDLLSEPLFLWPPLLAPYDKRIPESSAMQHPAFAAEAFLWVLAQLKA